MHMLMAERGHVAEKHIRTWSHYRAPNHVKLSVMDAWPALHTDGHDAGHQGVLDVSDLCPDKGIQCDHRRMGLRVEVDREDTSPGRSALLALQIQEARFLRPGSSMSLLWRLSRPNSSGRGGKKHIAGSMNCFQASTWKLRPPLNQQLQARRRKLSLVLGSLTAYRSRDWGGTL